MRTFSDKIIKACSSRYQEIFGNYNRRQGKKIMMAHFGELSHDFVSSVTHDAKLLLIKAGDRKGTVKRICYILVEGLQNMLLHGEKSFGGHRSSFFIIAQDERSYFITFANLVKNENIASIRSKVEQINAFEDQMLKAYYMETLTNGVFSNKGGAGLGFITLAIKSKNKLDYKFREIDTTVSCITLDVKVSRMDP